jgi:hypothetical protein
MKLVIFIFASVLLVSFITPVTNDFKKVFGSDYTWAVNWIKHNDALLEKYASHQNLSGKELKAIVFPELIRYNGLFNALEIESLKYLYVKEGKYYADFSVGYFQMKPSFAEMVEEDVQKLLGAEWLKGVGWNNFIDKKDSEHSRKQRVERLASTEQQIIYLCAFYKICELKFGNRKFSSPVEKLKLFATSYNAGYRRNYGSLMAFQRRNDFLKHNYASISAYYFEHE